MTSWINDLIEELFGVRFAGPAGFARFLRHIGYSPYRPGGQRLPKLFYALAPNASFTENDFGPLITDLRHALGGAG
jgi:hypothetical protein